MLLQCCCQALSSLRQQGTPSLFVLVVSPRGETTNTSEKSSHSLFFVGWLRGAPRNQPTKNQKEKYRCERAHVQRLRRRRYDTRQRSISSSSADARSANCG